MTDEVLKLALDALEGFIPYLPLKDETQCNRYDKAITALRLAIDAQNMASKSTYKEQLKEPDYTMCPTCGGLADDPIVPIQHRFEPFILKKNNEPVAWKAYEEVEFSPDFILRWVREGNSYMNQVDKELMEKLKNIVEGK